MKKQILLLLSINVFFIFSLKAQDSTQKNAEILPFQVSVSELSELEDKLHQLIFHSVEFKGWRMELILGEKIQFRSQDTMFSLSLNEVFRFVEKLRSVKEGGFLILYQ